MNLTTKQFLKYFPDFCLQTFSDVDNSNKTLTTCGKPSLYTVKQVADLNKKGAGIYFTPNQFPTGERKANLCKGVNAWIVDCDDGTKPDQLKRIEQSPVQPSFVIESKNGYHLYFLSKDAKIENYQTIVKGLIEYFKGDKACKDISRVLRVPGFLHQKDAKSPFMVKIVKTSPELKYGDLTMLESFPYDETLNAYKPLRTQHRASQGTFWEVIGSLDNKMVLERLSGKEIVDSQTFTFKPRTTGGEYIYVDGKMADAWIDDVGLIGSNKGGGPTWIQWVGFYGKSKREIAEWAKIYLEDYVRHLEVKEIDRQIKEITKPVVKKDYDLRYTWGTRGLDTSFAIIKRTDFTVFGAKRAQGKTSFTFDMACKNAKLGHKILYISLEMNAQEIKEDFARKYAGITIEEEYDYKIPVFKTKALERKIKEIEGIDNLHFQGVRRGSGITWSVIESLISNHEGLDMIFIDNLDLINEEKGERNLDKQIRIVRKIMSFTAERQIPIVLIHHYRKGQQGNKSKGMDELGGSGKISDSADRVIKISRNVESDALYPDKYRSTIHLQKARGYREAIKEVYFIRGTFIDKPPVSEQATQEAVKFEDILKII